MIDTEIKVNAQVAAEHGLTSEEYTRIQKILGRDPNFTELGIFSVMWSEHCSYKSSRVHLKRLPTTGSRVVQGPGENAGVVDIGDGLCAVFKIESHNHPSFVEPFQGAATGVGGILRDIFTMGARPIAVLDSLRFGEIVPFQAGSGAKEPVRELPSSSGHGFSRAVAAAESTRLHPPGAGSAAARMQPAPAVDENADPETIARNRRILDGVIRGIGFYGNCFGVPTVGGEVQFEPCYSNNPLVNALALGIARREELFFARARGAGNPVIYVGAKTGRDGIHGASLLASAEFSEESEQKRPNVQVGDPFMEKLLLEACLEAMKTGAVVAIQDMGAAGLTSSSAEMASRGGLGIEIDLSRVPQRETGMTPYEMMLSESQERMLLVAQRGREREVFDVFHKWGLDAMEVGRVTDDGKLRVLNHGRVAAEIPAHALAEEGPRYERPMAKPNPGSGAAPPKPILVQFDDGSRTGPAVNLTQQLQTLLASPAIASKYWITEQYDSMVQTNTRIRPGEGDAAVLRLKDSKRALAIKTDGNGRWCKLAPRLGAMHAVVEAARNVACTGARPVAATNCLNFGNPEKPEIMWQFSEAVDGIAEACRALDVPITGGNVSFYNETLGKPIYPTPILGVLGVMEDAESAVGSSFRAAGDAIVVLDAAGKWSAAARNAYWKGLAELRAREASGGVNAAEKQLSTPGEDWVAFSSSEYAKRVRGIVDGAPPAMDLAAEKRLIECLVELAGERVIQSAHDVSDGGLAVALAECCFAYEATADESRHGATLGAMVALTGQEPAELALFGERGARAVVSVARDSLARLEAIAAKWKVNAAHVGAVTRGEFRIQYNGTNAIESGAKSLRDVWAYTLPRAIEKA
jgi:phosphoribosylformylglycinamidine synthase subunit PurL